MKSSTYNDYETQLLQELHIIFIGNLVKSDVSNRFKMALTCVLKVYVKKGRYIHNFCINLIRNVDK